MLFLLKTGIVIISFKVLFSAFLPDFLIVGIPLVAFFLCLVIKFFNTPPLRFLKAGWLFFFALLHILVSSLILNPDLSINYIIAGGGSLLYISLYVWIVLLLNKNENIAVVSCLMNLICFALFFLIVEKILPNDEFHKLSNIIQSAKSMTDVAGESYRENIFGMSFERYGSVYFEPLTAAIIITSAYVLLGDIWRSKSWVIQVPLKIAVAVSFVKSAYLILALCKIASLIRSWKFFYVLIPIVIAVYLALTRINLADFERIEGLESIGNHLIGFYYGTLAGYDKWLFGNGVGTAGYNVYLEAIRRNEVGPFESLDDFSVLKNGNESALGIIFYQFGLLNALIALFPIFWLPIRSSIKNKDYISLGYIFALFIVSMLTESILSSVILTAILPMIVFRLSANAGSGR